MNAHATPAASGFDYAQAFSRNLGLVQPEEQARLAASRIAIAGLGGVGGIHAITLARMGIGAFHLADFDHFEIHNMNRQAGAFVSTLGLQKSSVVRGQVLDINPLAQVLEFGKGIDEHNVAAFLQGVDVVVDGIDFFAVDARRLLCRTAHAMGIPVVSAGPIGCSSALLVFMPGAMGWDEYYAMDLAKNEVDRYLLFALGTAPKATHMGYLDRRHVNLGDRRAPSLALAVQLCAGMAAAEVMKLLLGRGPTIAVPGFQQFDAYACRHVVGRIRWGNRGPLQRLKFQLLRRLFAR